MGDGRGSGGEKLLLASIAKGDTDSVDAGLPRPLYVVPAVSHQDGPSVGGQRALREGVGGYLVLFAAAAVQLATGDHLEIAVQPIMVQDLAGEHLRFGGSHSQNLPRPPQVGQQLRNSVVDPVFQHALLPIIFSVVLHRLGSLTDRKSAELLEALRQRRADKAVQLRRAHLDPIIAQGVGHGIPDSLPRVRQGAVQVKQNRIV